MGIESDCALCGATCWMKFTAVCFLKPDISFKIVVFYFVYYVSLSVAYNKIFLECFLEVL